MQAEESIQSMYHEPELAMADVAAERASVPADASPGQTGTQEQITQRAPTVSMDTPIVRSALDASADSTARSPAGEVHARSH